MKGILYILINGFNFISQPIHHHMLSLMQVHVYYDNANRQANTYIFFFSISYSFIRWDVAQWLERSPPTQPVWVLSPARAVLVWICVIHQSGARLSDETLNRGLICVRMLKDQART